jgi:hypothetical protein
LVPSILTRQIRCEHVGRATLTRVLPLLVLCIAALPCEGHPIIENALDVVIDRNRIVIDARISPEEILVVEAGGRITAQQWPNLIAQHAQYVAAHLLVSADNTPLSAAQVVLLEPPANMPSLAAGSGVLLHYRLQYPLAAPPAVVRIDQNFLRELQNWFVSFVLRIRQSDQPTFDTAMLSGGKVAEYGCEWKPAQVENSSSPAGAASQPSDALRPTPQPAEISEMYVIAARSRPSQLLFAAAVVVPIGLIVWIRFRRKRNAEFRANQEGNRRKS